MSKSIVIAIDIWPGLHSKTVSSIIKITNIIQPEAFLLATYGKDGKRPECQNYHPFIKDRIQVYTEELIPETYKNRDFKNNFTNRHIDKKSLQNILLLEKSFDFDNIIMMGGAWNQCVHHRSYGIFNLKQALPNKNILVNEDTVVPRQNFTGKETHINEIRFVHV
tara:strand:+ start:8064 stop:8558 length:495 start_codon:yes stop_codon:yes gene_type:complete